MSLTTTETLGFADGVIEFLTNNQASLQASGLNVRQHAGNKIPDIEA